jgi:hypothetical protein
MKSSGSEQEQVSGLATAVMDTGIPKNGGNFLFKKD